MAIKFDPDTDYDLVRKECGRLMSDFVHNKCGCNKANTSDLNMANILLDTADWEKTNEPSRWEKTLRTVYYLLYSLR